MARRDLTVSKVMKTLDRVLRGNADANVRFDDLRSLLGHPGFVERIRSGHHIFTRDGVVEILNLQPRGGDAKAYQVKQVRGVIVSYGLAGEPEEASAPGDEAGRAERIRRKAMGTEIRYEIMLYWSKDDLAFVAEVPELPGCAADGATYRKASENVEVVIREWIETARELGRVIPEPRGRLLLA